MLPDIRGLNGGVGQALGSKGELQLLREARSGDVSIFLGSCCLCAFSDTFLCCLLLRQALTSKIEAQQRHTQERVSIVSACRC